MDREKEILNEGMQETKTAPQTVTTLDSFRHKHSTAHGDHGHGHHHHSSKKVLDSHRESLPVH
jgi:hypothetical protein